MSSEQPLTSSFVQLTKRFTSRFANGVTELLSLIIPVVIVGSDRSDLERGIIVQGDMVPAGGATFFATAQLVAANGPVEIVAAWAARTGGACLPQIGSVPELLVLPVSYPPPTGVDAYEGAQHGRLRTGVTADLGGARFAARDDETFFFPVAGLILPVGEAIAIQTGVDATDGRVGFAWRNIA